MPTAPTFFAAEIVAYRPGTTTLTVDQGHGTHPAGTLAQFADAIETTATIYASDMGYRTLESDAGGLIAYPPVLSDAFHLTAAMNLDPQQSGAAAAAGSLTLANPNGRYDAIASTWNSDARPVTVRYGQKVLEDFDGWGTKRSTTGTYIDASGTMQTAAAGVVRYDYSTGSAVALNEAAATNHIRNGNATGATAGTPGTLPTDWGWQQPGGAGISSEVVGSGIDAGIPYVDIRIYGTTNTGTYVALWADSGTIAAAPGQTWTASVYAKVVGGSLANLAGYLLDFEELNGAGTPLQDDAKGVIAPASVFTRYTNAKTLSNASVAKIRARIWQFGFSANSQPFDVTFRIGAAQVEHASAATSYIPTTGTAATRAADNLYHARGILLDPPLADLGIAFAGLGAPWSLTETALTIPLRDATAWLERQYQTSTYGGTGGLDGTADLAGRLIPRTRGGSASYPVCNVTPVLIDPVNLIYQWSDGPGTLVNLYEGAAKTITFASDTTDLYTGSTPAGQYRTDVAKSLFQLGSPPASGYAITCDVTGEFPTAGAVTTPAGIARYLLAEDMSLPSANLDTASFDAAATAYPYVAGLYFDGSSAISGVQALDTILVGWGASVVPFRDGTLRLLVLRALPSTATPVAAFDTGNLVSLTPRPLPGAIDPPAGQIKVGYNHNYTVQTTGINTTTATAAQQQFVTASDRYATWLSTTVLAAWRNANRMTLASPLLRQADAQAVANDLGALFGTRLRGFDAVLPSLIAATREMGEAVRVAFPMQDLAGGQLAQIVGYDFHSTDPFITLQVLL